MKKTFRLLRAGFSLIEVNMAIFVLAGGTLALLGLFPIGLRDSLASRQEMRVAAFADRFLGAVKIAAAEAEDLDDLKAIVKDIMDTSPGFEWSDDAGEQPDTDGNGGDLDATEDESGVFYRAWADWDSAWNGENGSQYMGNQRMIEVGILVTGENAKQNKRALLTASSYGMRVTIDPTNVSN